MKVSDIHIHDEYEVADLEMPIQEVAKYLLDPSTIAVIIHERQKFVGIITRYEFVKVIAEGKVDYKDLKAKDLMIGHEKFFTVSPETDTSACEKVIRNRGVEVLPVIDKGGDLIGVVTYWDILRLGEK